MTVRGMIVEGGHASSLAVRMSGSDREDPNGGVIDGVGAGLFSGPARASRCDQGRRGSVPAGDARIRGCQIGPRAASVAPSFPCRRGPGRGGPSISWDRSVGGVEVRIRPSRAP